MTAKKIMLLSGSHRGKKTTTNSILDYMEKKLSFGNTDIFREQVPAANPDMQFVSKINNILNECETILLCFPLYFDTLPYPLISTLESLADRRKNNKKANFFVIIHSGLPEAEHCFSALAVCKNFSERIGFNYLGSAIIPDTGAVDGASVEEIKRIRSILDKSVDCISCSGNRNGIIEFIGKPSMHPILFRIFGNMIMKHFAGKNRVSVFQKGYM